MNNSIRHRLIAIVTFIGGIYFFLEFVLPAEIAGFEFGKYHSQISEGVQVISAMAIGLGLINILFVHGMALLKARQGWINSLALIFGLLLMFLFEGIDFVNSERSVQSWQRFGRLEVFSQTVQKENAGDPQTAAARLQAADAELDRILKDAEQGDAFLALEGAPEIDGESIAEFLDQHRLAQEALGELIEVYEAGAASEELAEAHEAFEARAKAAGTASKVIVTANYEATLVKKFASLLFNGFFAALGAAMFSLLAFYIATAAYRSFRVRSLEAAIMMIAALFVMLGQIPHGPIYIWEGLPGLRLWLLKYLSTPAFRAIFFGASIAGLAMAVRMWLSLERSPLAEE